MLLTQILIEVCCDQQLLGVHNLNDLCVQVRWRSRLRLGLNQRSLCHLGRFVFLRDTHWFMMLMKRALSLKVSLRVMRGEATGWNLTCDVPKLMLSFIHAQQLYHWMHQIKLILVNIYVYIYTWRYVLFPFQQVLVHDTTYCWNRGVLDVVMYTVYAWLFPWLNASVIDVDLVFEYCECWVFIENISRLGHFYAHWISVDQCTHKECMPVFW